MKTENLTKARATFAVFNHQLREAHTDAVNSENQFGEALLFDLLEQADELQKKLDRIKDARK